MVLAVAALAWQPQAGAQQAENSALCRENLPPPPDPIPEPVAMVYGDSTSECLIDPATDSDSFRFDGSAGDEIRINVLGLSANFGPSIQLRDPMGTLVELNGNAAGASCQPNFNSICSVIADASLSLTGTYLLSISDLGANNIGAYSLQLERLFPDQLAELVVHESSISKDDRIVDFLDSSAVSGTVSPQTDLDHYFFYGTEGTLVWLSVLGQTANLGPFIQVRDPAGNPVPLLLNSNPPGNPDGASCQPNFNSICSFGAEFAPPVTGIYTMIVGDNNANNAGNYTFSLACVVGECSNDGDANADTRRVSLRYGESVSASVEPLTDADAYVFLGTPGDTIRFSVLGQTANLGPWMQVRDPNGDIVLDGAADGVACQPNFNSICSFTQDYQPQTAGPHTIIFYDLGSNNTGSYQITLTCVFSPGDLVCENLPSRYPDDVPENYWAFRFIEILANAGITSGCAPGSYCPEAPITRAQMAVFLERGIRGGNYRPPDCTGTIFADVPCNGFADNYVEQLFRDGVTSGCPFPNYCRNASVTRAQMAVFLLRGMFGAGYSPPPATGTVFLDVPQNYWAAGFIEQLAAEGITSGCGGGNYCPEDPITRAQMAVFMANAFGLPDVIVYPPTQ